MFDEHKETGTLPTRFNPRTGVWSPAVSATANEAGIVTTPRFPTGQEGIINDWAAKVLLVK